jgi:hypothetical protein
MDVLQPGQCQTHDSRVNHQALKTASRPLWDLSAVVAVSCWPSGLSVVTWWGCLQQAEHAQVVSLPKLTLIK